MTPLPRSQVQDLLVLLKRLEYERDHFFREYHKEVAERKVSEQESQRQLQGKLEEISGLESRLQEAQTEITKYHRLHEDDLRKISSQKSKIEEYQLKIELYTQKISHWQQFYAALKKNIGLDAATEEKILQEAHALYEDSRAYGQIKSILNMPADSSYENVLAKMSWVGILAQKYRKEHGPPESLFPQSFLSEVMTKISYTVAVSLFSVPLLLTVVYSDRNKPESQDNISAITTFNSPFEEELAQFAAKNSSLGIMDEIYAADYTGSSLFLEEAIAANNADLEQTNNAVSSLNSVHSKLNIIKKPFTVDISDVLNKNATVDYKNACGSKHISFSPRDKKPINWKDYSCQPSRENCLPAGEYVTKESAEDKKLCYGCCEKKLVCCPPTASLPPLPPPPPPPPAVITAPPVSTVAISSTAAASAVSTPTPAALSCPETIAYEKRNDKECTFTPPSAPVLSKCNIMYTMEHDIRIEKKTEEIILEPNKSSSFMPGKYCELVQYPCTINLEMICFDVSGVEQQAVKGKTIISAEIIPEKKKADGGAQ